ncbi:MAG TPA: glycosyltransferase, partial [Thermoanaerobaculia bacterium]|nr:glycosyltransferase [Thermoanaerobaculia bacterium]
MPYAIGIDARKLFDFGIGTYIKHLIEALAAIDAENRYFLLTTGEGRDALSHLPENFKPVVERSQVYSLSELLRVSQKLRRLGVDLYHSTHYVLPAFLPCPAVATIHDIIHLLYPDFLPNRLALLYAQRMMRSTLSRA